MKTIFVIALSFFLVFQLPVSHAQDSASSDIVVANQAWLEGKYAAALRGYMNLLKGPNADQYFEQIALETGELFVIDELTTDGRNPRFSPDGKLIAYETGAGPKAITRIIRSVGDHAKVMELPGINSAFSPTGNKVVYLKLPQTDEFAKAAAALDNPALQGQARNAAQSQVNFLQAKFATLMLRDLSSQQETELNTIGLLKSTLAFGSDDETVYFVAGREGETTRNDILAVTASTQPRVVTDADGFKNNPIVVPGGKYLLVSLPNANPFPPPRAAGQQQGGGGGGGQFGQPTKFSIVEIASRKLTVVNGTAPTFSADGSSLAYIVRSGQEYSLTMQTFGQPFGGASSTVLKGNDRLDAPAFSPDGQRLAYQKMTRDDWEIYSVKTDGKEDTRITREIQHDVTPRFISNTTLLGMMGEPRHRRSYVYDLATKARTRLFHNNTVRTIAPEYAWAPNADGTKIVIQADRDGDTVSTERGVYLVNLDRKITKADLLARLEKNLASEVELARLAQKLYTPIADDIRRVVADESTDRIFGYEKTLFDFDSKYISQPGNRKALEFLHRTYASFGYEAEYQWFEPRAAFEGKTANVVATLRGTENPELIYVVGSHYDSVLAGPGADDDTTGTSALLEAARVLAKHPMPATIIFVSFTGEEAGLLGSREFVRVAQEKKLDVRGVLNNDMIGWANDNRLDNTIRYSNKSIRDIQHSAAMMFTKLITYDARYHRSTDATSFFEAYGDIVGGIGSYPVLGNPHYHQSTDLLEGINHQLITETSKTTVATLMLLASSPSPVKNLKVDSLTGSTAKISWTASPEKSVRSYVVRFRNSAGVVRQMKSLTPNATLSGIKAGTEVSLKAVNARGMVGWDWSRVTVK